MTLFICNIFKCKFKSCLRSSFHFFLEKFFLNINLELILHNISCGVKEIPSFWCHKKVSLSRYIYFSNAKNRKIVIITTSIHALLIITLRSTLRYYYILRSNISLLLHLLCGRATDCRW